MTFDHTSHRGRRWALAGATAILAVAGGAPTLTAAAASTHSVAAHAALHHASVSDADSGTTITVHRGATVKLTLHSTYWNVAGSSNANVLRERGKPVVKPTMAHCVPGGGCGTVSASFVAVATGSADITASRTTCGEAMMCAPAQASYAVHVVVVR
jgi:hypothetical protein